MEQHIELKAVRNWLPIVGRWTIAESHIEYLGPQTTPRSAPFGICVSNQWFSEGEARIIVQLPDSGNGVGGGSARFLLGFKSPNEPYYVVGLGGYGYAYTVSLYDVARGWVAVAGAGTHDNLRAGIDYNLKINIRGQRLFFNVNDIRVLEYSFPTPLAQGQLGLFTWDEGDIRFHDAFIVPKKGEIFVIMQLGEARGESYRELYSEVIQEVAKRLDLRAYHAGDVYGPGVILEDIVQGIVESKIVIAEITPPNQNVFYELGYAHALHKPTILLAERGRPLPFDISGYRCLFYENSIGGKRQVEEGLTKHITAILGES